MNALLSNLKRDYPSIVFTAGQFFCWSPKTNEVIYDKTHGGNEAARWSLLHEVGHALEGHMSYGSDVELIQLETKAWERARKVAKQYGLTIDENHIEDCMDTYRDWLHRRSACPVCDTRSLQQDPRHYKCYNCGQTWSVSSSRFCRPYRLTKQTKTSPSQSKAMFS